MLKETLEEVEREIPKEEWESLWDTRRMSFLWGFYYGILDRRPAEAEFDVCCNKVKASADKLIAAKTIAMELIKSAEFENNVRQNYTCEQLVAGFLMATLNEKRAEWDYDYYVNYCKSHNKSQEICENIAKELLNSSEFQNRF
jgi:hypothetical protein